MQLRDGARPAAESMLLRLVVMGLPVGMLMPGCLHPPQPHSSVGWEGGSVPEGKKNSWGQHPSSHLVSGSSLLLWALFGRAVHSYVLIVSVLFCYLYSIKKFFKKGRRRRRRKEKNLKNLCSMADGRLCPD